MKILRYHRASSIRLGLSTPAGIVDVNDCARAFGLPEVAGTIERVIAIPAALRAIAERCRNLAPGPAWLMPAGSVRLAPCLDAPEKIICVGLNYRRHAEESRMAIPAAPVLFSKFNNSLAADGDDIPTIPDALHYDYEVELGVIIGRETKNISVERALDAVFGYCTVNDYSARDLQMRTPQWLLGKTLDRFMPVGPAITTSDEIRDPQNLKLSCRVNGAVRQDSNTADMIFPIAYLISYISRFMTLKPGDLISTGTPEGVIFGMKVPMWMKPGDSMTVEIEGLGALTNRLVAGV